MSFLPDLTEQKSEPYYEVFNELSTTRPGSRLCIVLDNPTLDDMKAGKALNGTYGAILSQVFSICRITTFELSVVYLFPNVISSQSIWNEKTGFSTNGAEYIPKLKLLIEKLKPNVIVPMGECCLQALTGKHGITKWRGSMLSSTLCSRPETEESKKLLQIEGLTNGFKTIPTICPKVAVRMYLYRYYIIHDLKRAIEESFTPDINIPQRTLVTQPGLVDIHAYLDWILETKSTVAYDIEVHKQEVSCISFSHSSTYSMSIAIDNNWTEEEELRVWRKISSILADATIEKKLQNGLFDMAFLIWKNHIITRGYVHDTMIKHNLNYPDFPKGLGFICSIATREPYYKDDGKTWFNDLKSGKGSITQFYEYNAKDSAVLMEADPELQKDLTQYGNADTYEFCRRLMQPLLYMMIRGIKVDGEKLIEHRKKASEDRDMLQKELDTICKQQAGWGKVLNVSSPKQCNEYFYNALGLRPHTINAKDKYGNRVTRVSTSNKVMKKLATKGVKEAKLVQQIRAHRKLIGTYLNVQYDRDGRLRCSFNIAGTNTGRLSSSATIFGTGTNMQNLPKVFKEFLVADQGHIMCELDKAQAEWVVVAYLCGDANMIRTVETGEDAHINTAALMFGAPKELLILEDELLGSLSDEDKILEIRQTKCPEILKYKPLPNMSCRQGGKKSNHGLNYDLGDNGFAQTYGFSIEDARRCRALYHRAYPSIKLWHERVKSQLQNGRTLTNLLGRKRRFLDRWGDNLFKAAYAYVPQSTVAQLLNIGLVDVYEKQVLPEYGYLRLWDLLLQVHDSELFQYPTDYLWGLAQTIISCKESLEIPLIANGREFVIRTDGKIGYDAKNLEKIKIEGSVNDVYKSILTTKQKLDLKIEEKLKQKEIELLDLNSTEFDNEGADENELPTEIASPEETVFAGIDYF